MQNISNNKSPIISVIMPVYNTENYLAEALDSVIAQTFTDWEIICINDGSPDNSQKILDQYATRDKRIKVIVQKNSGVMAARNNGIRQARGKYIFPLDSDDIITPTTLSSLYKILSTTKYTAVCPSGICFGEESRPWILPKPTRYNMYSFRNGLHNSTIYPKVLWEKYGGYDEHFNLGSEDFDFFLNFIDDRQKVCQTRERLFYYRMKPPAESRNSGATWNKSKTKELRELFFKKRPIMRWYYIWGNIIRIPKKIIKLFLSIHLSEEKGTWSIRILKIPVISWKVPDFAPYVNQKQIRKVSFVLPEIVADGNAEILTAYLEKIRNWKKWNLCVYSIKPVKDKQFIDFCKGQGIRLKDGYRFPFGKLALKIRLHSVDVLIDSKIFDFNTAGKISDADATRLIGSIQDTYISNNTNNNK